MDRDESWQVIDEQRGTLADLLETLTPEEWTTPSLCERWPVRDVAAHLSMAAAAPLSEVMGHVVRARGSFDRMIHDSAVDRATRPTEQIVGDLRGIVGSRRLAPGTFWRDPLLDILVHGQDIVVPLGRSLPPRPEAARTAAEWAWVRRFPFFPARRLRGIRLVADDIEWTRGRGEELRGPITSLLLLSTGRAAGLAGTTGPGAELVRARHE
ncbi:MAG: maleylpyruvate isomerase family mycothiol-dependent enzyme [Nocardioides sp.]